MAIIPTHWKRQPNLDLRQSQLEPKQQPLNQLCSRGTAQPRDPPWQALGCAGPRREQKRIQPKHYSQPKS